MRIVAIIQARMSSTRLPGKILTELNGKPMLVNILERVSQSRFLDDVVVATSLEASDDGVESLLNNSGFNVFRGSLDNVLERYFFCAQKYNADVVIRLTGDNALVDPRIIDDAITIFKDNDLDYLFYKEGLPLGMCVEVFTFSSLKKAYEEASDSECIEHVTPYIRFNPEMFHIMNYGTNGGADHSDLRFTMDTPEDYEFVKKIYDSFDNNKFSLSDIMNLLDKHPNWISINNNIIQNKVEYHGEQ